MPPIQTPNQSHELVQRFEPEFTMAVGHVASELFVSRELHTGQVGQLSWQIHERLGKQQPVAITKFQLPDSTSLDVVIRPTNREFVEIYDEFPVVQKYFPRKYTHATFDTVMESAKTVAAMEKLDGFHADYKTKHPTMKEYAGVVNDPAKFDQLCREVFEMADEILVKPLALHDIRPVHGHNLMFNTNTGHFQLFDIDTISRSDKPHLRKFLDLIEPGQRIDDDREIEFTARMMQQYMAKYPEAAINEESDTFSYDTYVPIEDPASDGTGVLFPTSAGYMEAYTQYVNPFGTRGKKDLPALKPEHHTGRNVTTLNAEIMQAIKETDLPLLKELLNNNRGYITSTVFVENDPETNTA